MTDTHHVLVGDAATQLADLDADSVDMMLTSPPYWGLRDYTDSPEEIGQELTVDGYLDSLDAVWSEVERVLKPTGLAVINIDDCYGGSGRGAWDADDSEVRESYSPDSDELPDREDPVRRKSQMGVPERMDLRLLDEHDWIRRRRCFWRKTNPMPDSANDRPQREGEPVFVYAMEPDHYWDKGRPRLPEVIEHSTSSRSSDHPATMPEGLCKRLIQYGCPPEGVVLDPFAGSGTTLRAARDTGRHSIGVELCEKWADAARADLETNDQTLYEATKELEETA